MRRNKFFSARRRPKYALLLLLVLLPSLSAACAGDQEPAVTEEGHRSGPARDGEENLFPLTVIDASERTVTLPAPPERIIALAPNVVEILVALDAEHLLVGIDDFSELPQDGPQIKRVGGVLDPDMEVMLALNPDLFIAVPGAETSAEGLAEANIPALIIRPDSFAETLDLIRWLGEVTGRREAANKLAAGLTDQLAEVRAALGAATPVPVFFEVYDDPLMTVGPGTFIDDLIRLAGGENIAHDAPVPWPQISLETVVEGDPRTIVVMTPDSRKQLLEQQRPGWSGLAAVQAGRVHVINEDLISRPGPHVVRAIKTLAAFFHPDRFP